MYALHSAGAQALILRYFTSLLNKLLHNGLHNGVYIGLLHFLRWMRAFGVRNSGSYSNAMLLLDFTISISQVLRQDFKHFIPKNDWMRAFDVQHSGSCSNARLLFEYSFAQGIYYFCADRWLALQRSIHLIIMIFIRKW